MKKSYLEKKAEKVATEAHRNQYRKDNVTPAICHPRNVVNYLKQIGIEDGDIFCSAWLHDTIEDTFLKIDFIKREFNPNIARIVQLLTKNGDRKNYNETIKNADYSVQIIKLADVVDNCSDLNEPYIPDEIVRRKIDDCKSYYFSIAEKICPEFYSILLKSINNVRRFSEEKLH